MAAQANDIDSHCYSGFYFNGSDIRWIQSCYISEPGYLV